MTPEQKSGLNRFMLRWPERRRELLKAIADAGMLDLCESYEIAALALARWAHRTESEAVAIADDYRRILHELEDELVAALGPAVPPTRR